MSSPDQLKLPQLEGINGVPHDHLRKAKVIVGLLTVSLLTATTARATLPPWLQHIIGASTIESALYRAMPLPTASTLYPRPPKESQAELSALIKSTPNQADLYQLRARADEQVLDETAAEADWKQYAARAEDTVPAQLELADFYQRRLEIPQAIAVLKQVAAAPSLPASEAYIDPTQQRSWRVFDRIFTLNRRARPARRRLQRSLQRRDRPLPRPAPRLRCLLPVRTHPTRLRRRRIPHRPLPSAVPERRHLPGARPGPARVPTRQRRRCAGGLRQGLPAHVAARTHPVLPLAARPNPPAARLRRRRPRSTRPTPRWPRSPQRAHSHLLLRPASRPSAGRPANP